MWKTRIRENLPIILLLITVALNILTTYGGRIDLNVQDVML